MFLVIGFVICDVVVFFVMIGENVVFFYFIFMCKFIYLGMGSSVLFDEVVWVIGVGYVFIVVVILSGEGGVIVCKFVGVVGILIVEVGILGFIKVGFGWWVSMLIGWVEGFWIFFCSGSCVLFGLEFVNLIKFCVWYGIVVYMVLCLFYLGRLLLKWGSKWWCDW